MRMPVRLRSPSGQGGHGRIVKVLRMESRKMRKLARPPRRRQKAGSLPNSRPMARLIDHKEPVAKSKNTAKPRLMQTESHMAGGQTGEIHGTQLITARLPNGLIRCRCLVCGTEKTEHPCYLLRGNKLVITCRARSATTDQVRKLTRDDSDWQHSAACLCPYCETLGIVA